MMAQYLAMESAGMEEESSQEDIAVIRQENRRAKEEARRKRAEEVAKGPEAPQATNVPDLEFQRRIGKVLVWLHDMSPEPGKTYRYRLRVKFVNPLLTYANSVTREPDARQPYVFSPYSDWSEPVHVPRLTEFFVTGASSDSVRVAVFTRSFGQEVKEDFTVAPGELIGGVKTKQLTHPARGQSESVAVNFQTRAVAVGVDLNKAALGGAGVRSAVELLYLDEDGAMQSVVDIAHQPRNSPEAVRYRQLEEEIRLARDATKAAAATP